MHIAQSVDLFLCAWLNYLKFKKNSGNAELLYTLVLPTYILLYLIIQLSQGLHSDLVPQGIAFQSVEHLDNLYQFILTI